MSGHGHKAKAKKPSAAELATYARVKATLNHEPATTGPFKGMPYWLSRAARSTADWWPKSVQSVGDLVMHLRRRQYVRCEWDDWVIATATREAPAPLPTIYDGAQL